MADKYNFKESEKKWQDFWEQEQVYAFDLHDTTRPVYSIDTPPPTVSGKLHIGHIFSYTQAECIARYKRMQGFNVFYPMGYDDNGIPTEILVEKELGINIKDTPRQEFVAKCLEVNQKYRDIYKTLWQANGMSIDWNRTYATILPEVQAISQKRFVELYKKGAIVKKDFPALRCTKNQTTIAQAETEEQEFNEFFNDIKFTLSDGSDCIIATTRPEMLPACVAVFVHPDDERYARYIGQKATTPFGKEVPVLADDKVKMDKGTGAVMCCSYGDPTDLYWIKKYNLPEHIVINRYGKMQNTGLEGIDGLKITEAREMIIPIVEAKGALVKRIAIVQSKTISERGKVAVEIIPVPQWFVNILDKKEELKALNDKMTWYPDHMQKRSTDWIDKLEWDWNISRNRKFGIPIPVWYSKKTGWDHLARCWSISTGSTQYDAKDFARRSYARRYHRRRYGTWYLVYLWT
jgi:valyl-tRNA synthetase